MLSFAVFADNAAAQEWPLRHAYLIGPGETPLPADIQMAGGIIRCEKRSPDASALCVQFPVDPIEPGRPGGGLLALQTCLLPEREAPYLLSLELARHRLMLLINKLEDWALFDLPPTDPAMELFEAARHAFTAGVVAQGDRTADGGFTPEADRLARRSLSLALEASERLAFRNARAQIQRRLSGELARLAASIVPPENALTPHETMESRNSMLGTVGVILPEAPKVGVSVTPDVFSPGLQKLVAGSTDFLRLPMRWIEMEPTEGRYAFANTDRWIEWAVRHARLPVRGGALLDFRPRCVPEWLYIWEHDYETLRDLVGDYVKNIVTRYRRTIGTWVVASGLHSNTSFKFTLEQIMDLTRLSVLIVRKLQPNAVVQVELDQPWGDAAAETTKAVPPMFYAEMCNQIGLNVDAFALRIQMGIPHPGRSTRDAMAFSAMLDRYASLERPIAISAIGAPSRPFDPNAPLPPKVDERPDNPGYWRRLWSPQAQAEWLTTAAGIALSKPFVESICWDELQDLPRTDIGDGLVAADGAVKPAATRLAEIRQSIKDRRSPLTLLGAES